MDYYSFHIQTKPENVEILLAFLGELPFDSFEEKESELNAFVKADEDIQSTENELISLQENINFTFQKELIKGQNWNQVWESNFQPLLVDKFCAIRANFHEPIHDVEHEIIINPKMAFGTGHHETTFMMIQTMKNLDFNGKTVLDYGCGTGILAILASRLGAKLIDAVDIEIESYENTIENARENSISNINSLHGLLENITATGYDIILANINRNVILNSLGALYEKLCKSGKLIVSGILKQDENILMENAKKQGFGIQKVSQKNNWICCIFNK